MAYQVLARKYRPQRFSDVVGQDHVTRTLLNALSQKRIAHGYIFSGHRGIGKTTIARILAAALNCQSTVGSPERPTEEPCGICVNCREISSASRQESSIFEESHSFDVEEIDAATNRGIDDARLLTAKIQTRPTNKSKYRIIILDEAHQITDAAWNALLKTLEEPPDWAVFMFATTQPEDIPQTIRSRCQHFSFHAVKLDDIVGQLRRISTAENILADDATLTLLAEAGDGSMRDALSIMDQAIASAPMVDNHPHLEITQIRELMGSVSNVVYEQILEAVHANNSADVLSVVGRLLDAGNGAPQLARQFVRYLRNTIVAKVTNLSPGAEATGIAADLLQISPEERHRAARSAALFTEEELSRFLSIMLRTFDELGYRQEQRFHLELGLLKLVHMQRLVPIEDLLSQLGAKPTSTPKTIPSTTSTPPSSTPSSNIAPSGIAAKNNVILSEVSQPHRDTKSKDPVSARPAHDAESFSTPNPAPPPPSPFEYDRTRKSPTASNTSASPAAATTAGSLALAGHPTEASAAHTGPKLVVSPQVPASSAQPELPPAPTPNLSSRPERSAVERPAIPGGDELHQPATIHTPSIHAAELIAPVITSPAVPAAPITPPAGKAYDLTALQHALAAALASNKGQQSASEQIEDATLTLVDDTLQIQTTLSKTMLPVVLNADAERILKASLRDQTIPGAPTLKLKLLPGTPAATNANAPKTPRAAASGSAAELAEKHPIVQQARRLFSADISNVIDLRGKD